MNKVVRHYPVDRLPADLRGNLPENRRVRIEFELESEPEEPVLLAPLIGSVPTVHGRGEEVIEYIRQLREDR